MGDIGMIKGGGLAWLIWQGGVVVDDVVDTGASAASGSTGEKRGKKQ